MPPVCWDYVRSLVLAALSLSDKFSSCKCPQSEEPHKIRIWQRSTYKSMVKTQMNKCQVEENKFLSALIVHCRSNKLKSMNGRHHFLPSGSCELIVCIIHPSGSYIWVYVTSHNTSVQKTSNLGRRKGSQAPCNYHAGHMLHGDCYRNQTLLGTLSSQRRSSLMPWMFMLLVIVDLCFILG